MATSDTAYRELRRFPDRHPLGFPETESDVEIESLERLFTEEEAKRTVRLLPAPEEVPRIAERPYVGGVSSRYQTTRTERNRRSGPCGKA